MSAGKRFREALDQERPLQIAGTINAYCALMAKRSGFRAIYLSGAGVANASYGKPDLGMTTLDDVLIDATRITQACDVPLLVDIDTGWQDMGNTVVSMTAAGVAAVHLEDQVAAKRCGHRPNKTLVSCEQMVQRVSVAVKAKTDPEFFIIARTDALAVEGDQAALARALAYEQAGADAIFVEAVTDIDQYQFFSQSLRVPVLANMTEFGKTPLCDVATLHACGVAMVLYPLSAFRAMNHAALNVYDAIKNSGTQQSLLDQMQDRDRLYDFLDYHRYEQNQDDLE